MRRCLSSFKYNFVKYIVEAQNGSSISCQSIQSREVEETHVITLFIATELITISSTTSYSRATSSAHSRTASSLLSLWYCGTIRVTQLAPRSTMKTYLFDRSPVCYTAQGRRRGYRSVYRSLHSGLDVEDFLIDADYKQSFGIIGYTITSESFTNL
jgi:hypothetical protein